MNGDEFATDVRLIFSNCYKYNPPEHDVVKMAKKLSDAFEVRFAKMPDEPPEEKLLAEQQQQQQQQGKMKRIRGASSESSGEESDSEDSGSSSEDSESESERASQLSYLQKQV